MQFAKRLFDAGRCQNSDIFIVVFQLVNISALKEIGKASTNGRQKASKIGAKRPLEPGPLVGILLTLRLMARLLNSRSDNYGLGHLPGWPEQAERTETQ